MFWWFQQNYEFIQNKKAQVKKLELYKIFVFC